MQTADQTLQALRKLGEKRLPLTRVYRCLFNEDLFLVAYDKIRRNQGALTPGTGNDTATRAWLIGVMFHGRCG